MNIQTDVERLSNRIWITKKSRMESEARLKKNNTLANTLVAYYTFFVLGFSIWSLILNASEKSTIIINVAAVIASVGLFGLSLLIANFNFSDRANQFKQSYLSLDELEHSATHFVRSLPTDQTQITQSHYDELYEMEKSYNNILSKTENHAKTDYVKMLIDSNKQDRLSVNMIFYYYLHKLSFNLFISVLYLIPIVTVVWIFITL
ncbi:SLATT domain-containing protein [Paenibacillus dokdonensis]|uniref:SLATT domain-containing protein n=1 Tax=Paenibacillus dokdonensis TaxID=2567944 RepID=UPI0010A8D422|nr:SLATT domain-containing protein [Paenibacillus dokdonensis]